jgi:hypothetical protein
VSQAALTSNKALKSRRERPIKLRERILFLSARGDTPESHGPLQRLLERMRTPWMYSPGMSAHRTTLAMPPYR